MRCPKCDGKGYIECYAHVARGVCFMCNGRGVVNGRSQKITSVKTTQLVHLLHGTNKRETKLVLDMALDGGSWTTTDVKLQTTWDRLVALGHMVRNAKGHYSAAEWFTFKSISILVDWSK